MDLKSTRETLLSFNTRLLERQIYLSVFEGLNPAMAIKAIEAYHNDDGGFGNGIEPDIVTPESSGIALETALYYFDVLGYIPDYISRNVVIWLDSKVNNDGVINFPQKNHLNYPYMPWWKNSDDYRILSIAGLLYKLEVEIPAGLRERINRYAEHYTVKDELEEYDYPIFIYSLFNRSFSRRDEFLSDLDNKIIDLNRRKNSQFILFSRYWKFFLDIFNSDLIKDERERFLNSLDNNGVIPSPYPELPWWTNIFTLDIVVTLKHYKLL